MKLYYFNPNNYGEQAFVCAESPEKAKEYLLNSLVTYVANPTNWVDEYDREKVSVMANLEQGYTLEEYPVGKVCFSEIS